MARRLRNQKKADETLVDIVEVRDQAQSFFDRNQKTLFGLGIGLILIFGGVLIYRNFYQEPRQKEAMEQMFQAQKQFERDSFALALTNPGGGYMGFLNIIDTYGNTKAGNLAQYYAGICYLNLGEYNAALDYLKTFDASGDITPTMKYGAIGDAYSELGDFDSALDYYQKAANEIDNEVISAYYLKKLGMLHEKQGNLEKARAAYERIKEEFPDSPYGLDIDKYITRVSKG